MHDALGRSACRSFGLGRRLNSDDPAARSSRPLNACVMLLQLQIADHACSLQKLQLPNSRTCTRREGHAVSCGVLISFSSQCMHGVAFVRSSVRRPVRDRPCLP
jgi:hypothetical protein